MPTLSEFPSPDKTGWTKEHPQLPRSNGSPLLRVSIVTPSYNQAKFIEETLLSVKGQDYPNLEHIVIDGGSTDGTLDILRKYENSYNMRWISEPDEGQADAVNKGYRLAQGELLGWLNSDDTYVLPEAVGHIARAYQQNPHGRVFFGDCQVIDEKSRVKIIKRQHSWSLKTLLLGTSLTQPGFFIHKDALADVGYLDQTLHYALDWSFTIRLFSYYSPDQLIHIPIPVANSREYGVTKSSTGGKRITSERRRFLESYYQRTDLPEEAYKLRSMAFMATYWREAMLELQLGHLNSCFAAAWNAFRLNPSSIITRVPRSMYRIALGKRGSS